MKKILVHPRDRLARKTRDEVKFVKQIPVYPRDRLAIKMRDEVKFVKQVPVHPRDRLSKKARDEVKFVKQVPLHPRERLKRKFKLENYAHFNKKSKNEEITFIKQVTLYPHERLKRHEKINKIVDLVNKIGKPKKNTGRMKKTNTKKLMISDFNFYPKKILSKTLLFDTSTVDEEVIIDKIADGINDPFNDKYWIEHEPRTDYFT